MQEHEEASAESEQEVNSVERKLSAKSFSKSPSPSPAPPRPPGVADHPPKRGLRRISEAGEGTPASRNA